jgi:hypothetical protein
VCEATMYVKKQRVDFPVDTLSSVKSLMIRPIRKLASNTRVIKSEIQRIIQHSLQIVDEILS